MSTPSFTNPTPQFGTAEFKGGPDRCQLCGQMLSTTYYRFGQNQACPQCAEKAKFEMPKDTHSAFVRGILFACGGALLGFIAYSTFAIVTGIVIGYLALLVGWLVAKAMMKGSGGIGGRRYQITAVMLTYAAVSMSAIPIGISQIVKQQAAKKKNLVQHVVPGQTQQPSANSPALQSPQASSADDLEDADEPANSSTPTQPAKPEVSFGAAAVALLFAGLAYPFLALQDPFHGIIGLVILGVGIRIAWQLTAGKSLDILGPFNRAAPPPPLG